MQKIYYTLLSREKTPEGIWGIWRIEFGDYDRKVVVQERQDQKESNTYGDVKQAKVEYQIIKTLDSQQSVNDTVNELNNKL